MDMISMEVRVCNLRVKLPEPHLVAGAGIDASSRRAMGIFFFWNPGEGVAGAILLQISLLNKM